MLRMSWSTFRERWQVFIGAIVTVCIGVALFQSSLLLLLSAATAKIPPGLSAAEELALRDGYIGAISLLGMTLGLATFVATFIVSSTFAFAVAQRRRDLALLRLTGASRGQVRRLLLGEALLLGTLGSALGVLLGQLLMQAQARLLSYLELAPPGFAGQWRSWMIFASMGTGVSVAVCGVLAASGRASRVRPLEALREIGPAARVMTASRWIIGVLFLAGSVALIVLVPAVGGEAAIPISINIVMVLVIALAALAPLIVPLVGRVLQVFSPGYLGQLAHANLRSGVRRSASTAAPIMVLTAFVAGMAGAMGTLGDGARHEVTQNLRGDLVVTAQRSVMADLVATDEITAVSEEIPVAFDVREVDGDVEIEYDADGWAVDPAAYVLTHRLAVRAGDLADLHGASVAVASSALGLHGQVGDTLTIRFGDHEQDLRIVALLPQTLVGPYFLLPHELVPTEAAGLRQYVIQIAEGADAAAVATRLEGLAATGPVEALPTDEWIRRNADEQQKMSINIMVALLGLSMLYTVIAMVNAVVISASDRRGEFATARVTGLTRGQVVRLALHESLAVVAIGLILGALAATGTVLGFASAVKDMTGLSVVSVPWPLLGALAVGAAAVVGVTTVLTTLAATRTPAIRLVAARE